MNSKIRFYLLLSVLFLSARAEQLANQPGESRNAAAGDSLFYPPKANGTPPASLIDCLSSVDVEYYDNNGVLKSGTFVVNKDLADDVRDIFKQIKKKNSQLPRDQRFPITSIIPVNRFGWDDERSMEADNSSAYNFRLKTGGNGMSLHSYGRAMDLNTKCNPYVLIRKDNSKKVDPPDGKDPDANAPSNCTITPSTPMGSFVIQQFKSHGWKWGGEWNNPKDYQHFEKTDAGGQHPTAPYCGN